MRIIGRDFIENARFFGFVYRTHLGSALSAVPNNRTILSLHIHHMRRMRHMHLPRQPMAQRLLRVPQPLHRARQRGGLVADVAGEEQRVELVLAHDFGVRD